MSSNNSTTTILNDLMKETDHQRLKDKIEQKICKEYGEALQGFSAEEIDSMVNAVRDRVSFAPLTQQITDSVADRVLFAPTDTHWLANKAVDFVLTVGAVGAAAWASNRFYAAKTESTETTTESTNPFSDTTPATPAKPRVAKVATFDRQAQ